MRWPNLSNPNRNPPPNGPTAGILGPDLVSDQPKGAKFLFRPKFGPENIAEIFRPKAEMDERDTFGRK